MNLATSIPLTLYIHLPWCIRKCPYCDFNSHKKPDELPEKTYIQALLNELDSLLPLIWGRRLSAIFIGGGTPSLFSPMAIAELLQGIHARLPFHADLEITLEANPGTFEQEKFKGFRQAGINRLSLGIQSFNDEKLKRLGRVHGARESLYAAQNAREAGFTQLNLDLMHGLPDQTLAEALLDLQTALDCNPTHISWYQLTLEANTYFHKYPPTLPSDDLIADMQTAGQLLLSTHGFIQYEVSAYARAEQACSHNLNYWRFGDYLGLGAGAHSKLSHQHTQTITRHWNVKNPKDYLNPSASIIEREITLMPSDLIFEFMLNALRVCAGFEKTLFTERTGLSLSLIQEKLSLLQDKELLLITDTHIQPTELGQRFLNTIISEFLPAN